MIHQEIRPFSETFKKSYIPSFKNPQNTIIRLDGEQFWEPHRRSGDFYLLNQESGLYIKNLLSLFNMSCNIKEISEKYGPFDGFLGGVVAKYGDKTNLYHITMEFIIRSDLHKFIPSIRSFLNNMTATSGNRTRDINASEDMFKHLYHKLGIEDIVNFLSLLEEMISHVTLGNILIPGYNLKDIVQFEVPNGVEMNSGVMSKFCTYTGMKDYFYISTTATTINMESSGKIFTISSYLTVDFEGRNGKIYLPTYKDNEDPSLRNPFGPHNLSD